MIVKKVWGFEEIICNTKEYCTKKLHLDKNHQCSLHYHKIKDEVFIIHEGEVQMEYAGEIKLMLPGDYIRIFPGEPHRFKGIKNTIIIESSSHHEDNDSYRLEPSQ